MQPEKIDDNHVLTKKYVDSSSENKIKRRDFSLVISDQDNDLDNKKLATLKSITTKRNPL